MYKQIIIGKSTDKNSIYSSASNLSTDTGVKFSTAANPYLSQYGPDFTGIPGFGLNVNEQNSLNKQLSDKTVFPTEYTFQPNAVNNLLSSLGLPSESNKGPNSSQEKEIQN
jgi:hypothetical protein